jgi:hypothetical protein
MAKQFLLIIGFLFSIQVMSQTGIGTATPHASAKLEVASTDKGFLPPRIALTATNSASPITTPATGLVIFNTATAGTTPNNVLPGYYYWDGSKWNGLVDQSSLNSFSGFNPNYAQSNASSVTTGTAGAIIVSQSITTSGRPIQIIATGDANPPNAAWCQLQLYRDGVAIGKKLQAESSNGNENVPYCLNFIDNPTAGSYTYSVRYVTGSGNFQFGEADGNQITLLELGAWSAGTMPVSKGGTGNSSYTNGSLIFSDGTNLSQNNANLFWDNTNGRLGIGTSSPTSRLNIAGGGIKIHNGFTNNTARPSLTTTAIGSYEIRGVGSIEGSTQVDAGNDGFLRLSAGGGTNTTAQSSIDLSGFSGQADMNNNIVMRTAGTERLRIDNSGNVNLTGKLNVTDPSGGVAMQAAGFVNHSVPLTLGDIQVQMAPAGISRSLQIKTTGTSFSGMVSAYTTYNGASGTNAFTYFSDVTQTINSTFAHLGVSWGFAQSGDVANYFLRDTTNQRFYRITLMVGASWNNNFISIERLF